ncbi:MAG: ABC transporter ATP-binding protein/permease [Tyzzerella sp.]|nr:ABC transporter ATP-binding protein/permease [Tyzzerella sp.]
MLQIKNISKQYKTGDLIQHALNDVSLNFRDNEFVSILGPSGSGKTTLLNIVGGLDRYDSGDLIINNVSTKDYKDRDWDSYRNHTVGFVFQSYNLIPHQTVLANVELALTIGGISKKERKRRALQALDEVGLKEQAHKKPTQMSGGQMQRVAIARALVNNPDILLADEPTGALDTETSIQVMKLLKEVAKDRLVIMVTHNPELAEEYSTRIVKLRDGKIINDTDPFIPDEKELAKPEYRNLGKASMSLPTAFSLSFNNLLTKKGRTILTAFAGSIGIIGIALILSLSTGFQNYIDQIQEDTLTSYPLTITSETADTTAMLLSMVSDSGEEAEENAVKEKQYIATMFSEIGTNDLTSLKKYLEDNSDEVDDMVSLIQYKYSISPLIYTTDATGEVSQLNPNTMLASMTGMNAAVSTSMAGMGNSVFSEMMDDPEAIHSQYNVLAGKWPEAYNEMILVLPEEHGMPDMLVYMLGLRDSDELQDMMAKIMSGEKVENKNEPLEWTYEDLMNLPLKLVNATDTYKYNADYNIYESMVDDKEFMQEVYDNAVDLKIVGIVCAKDGSTSANLSPGVAYTKELTEYVIEKASESEIVKKQLADKEVDVFKNKRFDDESTESGLNFEDMISIDEELLASAFGGNVSEDDIAAMTQGYMTEISSAITTDTSEAEKRVSEPLVTFATNILKNYFEKNKVTIPMVGEVAQIQMSQVDSVVDSFMALEENRAVLAALETDYLVPKETFENMYSQLLKGMLQAYIGAMATDKEAEDLTAPVVLEAVTPFVAEFVKQDAITTMVEQLGAAMTEAVMQKTILTKVGELTGELMGSIAGAFNVDQEKIAAAFKFEMDEDELTRLMTTMSSSSVETTAQTNLISLGYQDINEPSSISFYFEDFDSKELFVDYLEDYNEKMEKEDEEKVIKYTDITGILMSSVKTIVDSVSYVLIAFVSISLVVSSIMIGIITYISVLERTKEIGVLRAIGASKRNISSIFNAETFIVGFLAGLLGIGVTQALVPVINHIIHSVTGNTAINAVLPLNAAITLVTLSVVLTLIGGLIPSKQAAKKDPVLALRSE